MNVNAMNAIFSNTGSIFDFFLRLAEVTLVLFEPLFSIFIANRYTIVISKSQKQKNKKPKVNYILELST